MHVVRAGAIYFALAFGAGFVLGVVRELWAVPRFGVRWAELMEQPVMLVVVIFAARWTVRRFAVPPIPSRRLGVGFIALSLLLLAELTVVLGSRGLSFAEYLTARDPVSGTVYLAMLGLFAVMPLLVARR